MNNTTTNVYNAVSQLTSSTDPLKETTTYGFDADGNQTTTTNPLNQTTSTTYDAQGRVLTATAPNGGVTTYNYDLAGNLTSLTDPDNNTTTYTYDAVNRLASTINPLGYHTTNVYNAGGELTSTTDPDGRTVTYGYDAVGRKTGETWVNGGYSATWTYDAAGRLTEAQDTNSVYTYAYDAADRLTSVSNAGTPGVPTVTLSFGYDQYSNRTSLTDSLGGSIAYTFDAAKNLTGLALSLNGTQEAQLTMAYDASNRLTGMTRSAGKSADTIVTSLTYDNSDRLTNITHTDTTKSLTLANYTYGYDTGSELTSYQDNSSNSLTYGYDSNGELTSASGTLNGSGYSVNYSYDKNGNRTMTGYSTGTGNELTSDGTYNYTYDNNGNTLTQTNIATGYVTYDTWDYRNRLTEVKQEDNHSNVLNDEKYTYDVNGNRIGVSLNGVQQLYTVYDGANPYIDFNGSGTLSQRYLVNPQGLNVFYGQVNASGTLEWFLTDNINSIRQVASTSGSVLDAITYDPYGSILNQTSVTYAPRFLYTGGAYDSSTNTYLDGAREESPVDGRWLNEDPLGLKPDSNPYRYVSNDPTEDTDPTGLTKHMLMVDGKQIDILAKLVKLTLKYDEDGKVVNIRKEYVKAVEEGKELELPPGAGTVFADIKVTNKLTITIEANAYLTQIIDIGPKWVPAAPGPTGQGQLTTLGPGESITFHLKMGISINGKTKAQWGIRCGATTSPELPIARAIWDYPYDVLPEK